MASDHLNALLDLLPVHAQRLSVGIIRSFEIRGIGGCTVIVQVLQSLRAVRLDRVFVIRDPPGYLCGVVPFDEPVVAHLQDLGVKPGVGEGVNRLHIVPERKCCSRIPMCPGG